MGSAWRCNWKTWRKRRAPCRSRRTRQPSWWAGSYRTASAIRCFRKAWRWPRSWPVAYWNEGEPGASAPGVTRRAPGADAPDSPKNQTGHCFFAGIFDRPGEGELGAAWMIDLFNSSALNGNRVVRSATKLARFRNNSARQVSMVTVEPG